jgi:hypothetical protein
MKQKKQSLTTDKAKKRRILIGCAITSIIVSLSSGLSIISSCSNKKISIDKVITQTSLGEISSNSTDDI